MPSFDASSLTGRARANTATACRVSGVATEVAAARTARTHLASCVHSDGQPKADRIFASSGSGACAHAAHKATILWSSRCGESRRRTLRIRPHSGCPSCSACASATTPDAVSYTHLRAHETDSYLVCRLLLEK